MDFNMSLLEAVRSEDLELLKTFMQNRVYNINECDEDGVTSLHIAAGLQDDTILQYLLEQGACIDCVTSDGLTPLHIAAMWGRSNHVHTLLSYGAKHYLKDSAGDDAYMHALKSKEVGSKLCIDLISSHIASLSLIDSSDTEYLDKNLSKEKGSELFITACESPELNKTPVVTHEIDLEKLNSSPWITPRRKDRVKVRKFRMKDGQENRKLLYDNQENGVNSFTQDESLNFFSKNGNFSQSDKILQNDQNVRESSKVEFDDYLTEMSLDLLSSSGCSDSSELPTFSYSTITCMETQRLYGSEMDDLGDVSRSFMSEFLTEWSSAEEGAELFTGNGKQYEDMVEQEMERNRKDNDGEGLGEQENDKQDGRGNWKEEEEEEKVRGGGHGEGAGGEGGKKEEEKEEEDDVDVEKEEEEDVDVDEEKEEEQEEEKQQDDDVVKEEEEDSKEEREEKQNGCHCEKEKKQKAKKNGRREDQVRVKENENKANGNYSNDNPLNSTFIVTPRCDDVSKKATNFFVPFQNIHADSDAFRRKTETTIVYDWKDCSSRETEESVAIPDSFRCASSEEIKKRIISFGQTPGPITPSTREVYLKKLWKLEHGHGQKNTKQNTLLFVRYPSELRMILTGRSTIPDCHNLEDEMMKEFCQSKKSQWRGGKEKSSFNYLLLDPRVSCNLPMRYKELSTTEAFRIFVLSVFYVGKGKRSRPYAHFHEAIKSHRTGKAILNSTITSNMVFTKTAQKFGQWSDPKAGTIYGVGFPSEDDLKKFEETFKKANGSVKSLNTKPDSSNTSLQPASSSKASLVSTSSQNGSSKVVSQSSSGLGGFGNQEESSVTVTGSKPMSTSVDAQLKYENDKLKLALAQSSANAKKWETELQNLRNNNARLTTALQESTSNVEEWKKQLLMYKDENSHLRTRVQELEFLQQESGKSSGDINQLQSEKSSLEHKVVRLEKSIEQQSQELANLTLQLGELQKLRSSNSELADRVRELKSENERLQAASVEFSTKEKTMAEQEGKMIELRELFAKLDTQLHEMNNIQELVKQKLKD